MHIELSENPNKEDSNFISQGIKSYNRNYISDDVVFEEDMTFSVFARDDKGNIIGGARARAFWNYCIIELLWLADEARGEGVGTALMKKAESYAVTKGFEYMRTETLSFQAKPFYEKLGYRVFGELPEHPKGHTTYCLVKTLKQNV